MANTLLALSTRTILRSKGAKHQIQIAQMGSFSRTLIGKREIVGFGHNGQPNYLDKAEFPLPAIRWKEPTPEIQALREKEKGDWKNLSIEEKKALYRASFRQTYAEFTAPTGEWKFALGTAFIFMSLALWLFYGLRTFVTPPLPESFSKESRELQLRRMLDLQVNPIEGISSKWDYEKDDWKK
ncbi:cytochrome c oxidase subunit 4 isoform 1, mitochondrial-like [Cylas formicarius]|uniref:cytochrome c oxidase subunit 4 isoform 1, mitochondrial-like n=1 Tax=Cylas formicarius TaxID=197179 RepID=UPI002958C692|nr:cytochrome c oxidase subunit 4 isoform 1, mitochondrial-like [Cylas formicarius]XP_060535521.1 cytochrome c oxidase subunit 4 isoform 1, mitochondrial-like [Cylas formicarius]